MAALILLTGSRAGGQSLTQEVTATTGVSTDEVGAVGGQMRLFGELESEVRFYVEGTWATRPGAAAEGAGDTDAFSAAYPYDEQFHLVEAYAERLYRRGAFLTGIRGGVYRTPFGIHDRGDHAYTGFLRAPLIRYDAYFGLSNNFLEIGVDIVAGTPAASIEVSLGAPRDIGEAERRSGFDPVVRAQVYRGPFIIGASHMRSKPYDRRSFARGDLVFSGIDVRWMAGGVQIRGEWITGRPFDSVSTMGWYVDTMVHRPAMGPVTLVARAEDLDYDAGPFSNFLTRYTVGARVQVTPAVAVQLNVLHQPNRLAYESGTTVDVGVTYVLRHVW